MHVFARLCLIAKSFWHYNTIPVDYGQIIIKPHWGEVWEFAFLCFLFFVLFCFFFCNFISSWGQNEVKMQNWENWSQTSVMIFPLIKTWLGLLKNILSIREADILCTHVGLSIVGSKNCSVRLVGSLSPSHRNFLKKYGELCDAVYDILLSFKRNFCTRSLKGFMRLLSSAE